MALDEYLFSKFVRYRKQKKAKANGLLERTARLEEVQSKLTILACAVSGRRIDIYPAEREGGYKDDNFFLPVSMSLFATLEENASFYLFRTLYLCMQQQLGYNWEVEGNSYEASKQKAEETSGEVLDILFKEFSHCESIYQQFLTQLYSREEKEEPDLSWLYGKWMRNEGTSQSDNQLQHISDKIKKAQQAEVKTTIKARAVEEIRTIEIDKKAQEDYVLTHNFEKVETAEEFDGVWRDFDGDDDLESHQDALDEINMKMTVRVDDPAHSIYQADFLENTNISESAAQESASYFIPYDEWDYKKRSYKKDFCRVYPRKHRQASPAYYKETLRNFSSELMSLRKMLANVNNKYEWRRRQTQGQELDMDAVTDYLTDVTTGHQPSEKIYLSSRKTKKDISILLLLDISLSSDGYVDGLRILDVEKQVAILFGEILHEYDMDFSIDCFNSKTRNHANYVTIKDFDDPWPIARNHIGSVEPGGYTRIGTAIRHSGSLLMARESRKKWLILLSDGKPNDFDKYEGKYGINDVMQALREFASNDLNAYAIAIEATARYYLPRMFGNNNYQIVSSPRDMIRSLVTLYEKIKYS
jgi:nitric oxide reductase NorD protein